jgi:hypothetical protein
MCVICCFDIPLNLYRDSRSRNELNSDILIRKWTRCVCVNDLLDGRDYYNRPNVQLTWEFNPSLSHPCRRERYRPHSAASDFSVRVVHCSGHLSMYHL